MLTLSLPDRVLYFTSMKGFKKLVLFLFLALFVLAIYIFFFPATRFTSSEKNYTLSPPLGKEQILIQLEEQDIIRFPFLLDLVYSFYGDWDLVQPGKYIIPKEATIWQIARMLKNSRKGVTKLVINKLRTKEDFAKLISHQFLLDSSDVLHFITSNDSLRNWGIDTGSFYTIIIPDTYECYRNSSLQVILTRLRSVSEKFWLQNDRLKKAEKIGLTASEVYTLASIVSEETNYASDQSLIASVYINRLHKKMPLQACPTIKFAMRDFSLTRIYDKYLQVVSPYNTYRNPGLPPGPICTPEASVIDRVLDAPKTDYLFFVAKRDFSGYHHFSTNYAEHQRYALEYQQALDIYQKKQQQKKP